LCGLLLLDNGSADVDEVIRDHAESGSALHSAGAFISATVESVPSLEYADSAFASGSPLLPLLEPAFLLLTLDRGAFGGTAWNGNTFHAYLLRLGYILRRIESGVARSQIRRAACTLPVDFNRRNQQIAVSRPPVINLDVDNDLALGFLHLDHLAEFIRFSRLAFAD